MELYRTKIARGLKERSIFGNCKEVAVQIDPLLLSKVDLRTRKRQGSEAFEVMCFHQKTLEKQKA
jgi:hypothetical protein